MLQNLDNSMESLDPAVQTVWAVKLGLWTLGGVLLALAYELTHLFQSDRWLPFGFWVGVVVGIGGVLCWVLPRLRYRFWRYALLGEELILERGIFTRVRTIVPLRRVQHLDIAQDLIEREFGLVRVVLHTAGTRYSTLVLPGLRPQQAEQLRERIKQHMVEDVL